MKKGQVVERGKHDELIAKDGTYKQLVSRQLIDQMPEPDFDAEEETGED